MLARLKQWMADLKAKRWQKRVEILPPLRPSRARPQPRKPHATRTAKVYVALASAPAGATYDELIAHVRAVTGRACSRKLIARWRAENPPSSPLTSLPALPTVTAAVTICAALIIIAACRTAPAPSLVAPSPSPAPLMISTAADAQHSSGSPRTLMIKLQVERPEDLKVKESQHVNAGDALTDRRIARAPLEAQREQAKINLAMMWQPRRLDTPQLPPAFFTDAETAVVRAAKAADDAARKLDNVKARLVQMAKLEHLPGAVTEHEEATHAALERESALAESELKLARANLAQAKAVRENAEYQNSLAVAAQRYREDEALQLAALLKAQFTAQVSSLDRQIALLGEVRAPFGGTVKRILWEEQNNNDITVVIHLALDADRDSHGSRSGAR